MKSYLIIVDKYLPYPSSTGVCAKGISNVLSKDSKITVLTIYGEDYFDEQNNINVFAVGRDGVNIPLKNILFGYIQDEDVVKNLVKKGIELYNKIHFDTIVSFYQPIETVISGEKLRKNLKLNHIPCFFDVVDTSLKTSNFKKKIIDFNYERLYRRALNHNGFIYLKYYKKYFDKHIFRNENKAYPIGTPNLIKKEYLSNTDSDIINITYCGSFYADIRNPRKMLDALKCIAGTNIYFHLYSWGCEDIVKEYKNIYGDNLAIHGRVSSEEVEKALAGANVLVNLSNTSENQVPGKVMEYFSYGKPVLNFKSIANDPGNEDYEAYPLIKNVELYSRINTQEIIEYINDFKNRQIPFTEIAEKFNDSTPEFCCQIINDVLNGEK